MKNRNSKASDAAGNVMKTRRDTSSGSSENKIYPVTGVVIGILTGIDDLGHPLVAYAGNQTDLPVAARSVAAVDPDSIGREVALLFESGDLSRPIVVGVVQGDTLSALTKSFKPANTETLVDTDHAVDTAEIVIDGQRIQLQAQQEIMLRCGKSSITMTRAGKVIIRGAYVSTRSSGVNRIKGGSVQIN